MEEPRGGSGAQALGMIWGSGLGEGARGVRRNNPYLIL